MLILISINKTKILNYLFYLVYNKINATQHSESNQGKCSIL